MLNFIDYLVCNVDRAAPRTAQDLDRTDRQVVGTAGTGAGTNLEGTRITHGFQSSNW